MLGDIYGTSFPRPWPEFHFLLAFFFFSFLLPEDRNNTGRFTGMQPNLTENAPGTDIVPLRIWVLRMTVRHGIDRARSPPSLCSIVTLYAEVTLYLLDLLCSIVIIYRSYLVFVHLNCVHHSYHLIYRCFLVFERCIVFHSYLVFWLLS